LGHVVFIFLFFINLRKNPKTIKMQFGKNLCLFFLFIAVAFTSQAQNLVSSNLLDNEKPLFIENKGQVADQNSKFRPDVKFIYAAGNYKLILRKTGFSHELLRFEKKPKQISEANGKENTSPKGISSLP